MRKDIKIENGIEIEIEIEVEAATAIEMIEMMDFEVEKQELEPDSHSLNELSEKRRKQKHDETSENEMNRTPLH